jgi:hypothetical protein
VGFLEGELFSHVSGRVLITVDGQWVNAPRLTHVYTFKIVNRMPGRVLITVDGQWVNAPRLTHVYTFKIVNRMPDPMVRMRICYGKGLLVMMFGSGFHFGKEK